MAFVKYNNATRLRLTETLNGYQTITATDNIDAEYEALCAEYALAAA